MTVVVPFTNMPASNDEAFELAERQRPKPKRKKSDTLAKARHHLRRNLPPIPTNRTGRGQDGDDYTWADLEQVDAIVWPFLDAYGLSWETDPDIHPTTGKPCLRWTLLHLDSGESATGHMTIRDGHPQDQGTAFTYAQRYALVIVSGAVVEKGDTDCARPPAPKQQAGKPEQPRTPSTRVTQQRVDDWTRSILALSSPAAADRAHAALRAQRIDSERAEVTSDARARHGLSLAGPVTLEDLVQAVRSTLEVEQDARGDQPARLAPVDDLPPEPDEHDTEPPEDEEPVEPAPEPAGEPPMVDVPSPAPPVDDDPWNAPVTPLYPDPDTATTPSD